MKIRSNFPPCYIRVWVDVSETWGRQSYVVGTNSYACAPRARHEDEVQYETRAVIYIVSYPNRRSSSGVFRRRTASEFTEDPSIRQALTTCKSKEWWILHSASRLSAVDFYQECFEDKRANRASYSGRVVVSATRSYGVPSPDPVAYHAGKSLKTLDPATTALLAGRYCRVMRVLWQIKSR